MMVVAEAEFICWCTCHGKLLLAKRAVSCSECMEFCLKEEGVYRIEFVCVKESPPYDEVEYDNGGSY
jgi:hypothetical protein